MAIHEPRREDTLHWGLGLFFAVGVHIGMAASVITWNTNSTPPPAPPPAVLIELAALPAAPPEPKPEPEETKSESKPPKVKPPPKPELKPKPEPAPVKPPPPQEVKPEPEPVPEIESAVEPEVALPKPVQEKTPPPEPVSKPLPPKTTASPTEPSKTEPMPEISPMQRAQAMQSWNAILLAHLSRYKHYPSSAKRRQHEGVAYLRFVMDREGRVLSARIKRSSSYALLDEEAKAMVKRAEPLPPPPPEVSGERIVLVVPVEFFLR